MWKQVMSVFLKILKHYFFYYFIKVASILTRIFKLNHFHFPVNVPFFFSVLFSQFPLIFNFLLERRAGKEKGGKKTMREK